MNLPFFAAVGQLLGKRSQRWIVRKEVLLPAAGHAVVILLWWLIALFRREMMPTPPEALIKNLDFILHPFYRRGPGDLGLGWLLLASLRRVCIGFLLGAVVAVPLGFLK